MNSTAPSRPVRWPGRTIRQLSFTVGGLIGTGGDVEGRTGSFSMHIKDGAGTGAGLWRE
ncbi:hypothetical protein [Henriciella mobilis]|uniref:hypothetical protein n=1 Tax=Henriciella mobilis TaxID=2305467 RepID=UPI001313E81B|nr:hypothetical protein [Henriciella mobilis]